MPKIKPLRFLFALTIFVVIFSFTLKVFAYDAIPTNAVANIPNTHFAMGENNWGPWAIVGACPLGTYNDTAPRDYDFYLDNVVSATHYIKGTPICAGSWNQQFLINNFGYYQSFWDQNIAFYFPQADPTLPHTFSVRMSDAGSAEKLFVSWDLNGGYGAPLPSCSDGIQNQDETGIDVGGICFDYSSFYSDTSEQIRSSDNHLIQTLGTNLTGTLTRIDIKTSNSSALYYGSRPWLSLYECDDDTYDNNTFAGPTCHPLYSGLSDDYSKLKASIQSFYTGSIVLNPLKYYFFTTQGNNMFNVLPVHYGNAKNTVDGSCYQSSFITITPCATVSDLYFRLYGISKLAIPPPPPPCTVDCFSNILFLPGLMGSRLYDPGLNCGSDIVGPECGDQELWVSASDSRQEKLALNIQGKSINNIYTKNDTQNTGELDETGIVDDVGAFNIYQSFIDDLRKWKDVDKIIADYAFIPYDWRLSLDDVIANGATNSNNDLSYTNTQNFSESFILKKLEALQKNSKSKKVTIIAHSNGGLVAKALIQKLKDTNNPLYDKIDKIIFVAVPQVGTPDAVASLLHGTSLGHGLIMSADRSRQLSENMSSVYNFLPSAGYFSMAQIPLVQDKLITFEDKQFFNSQISKYGLNISDEANFKNYVLGTDGRTKPSFDDTIHPNIGNSLLYNQAESIHQMLDSWQPSPNTKVIQVAGWGEETLAGLDYKSYVDFWGNEYLSYKPNMVIDGDGTVVAPSALWMSTSNPNVERWWVDLKSYNAPFIGVNRDHRDILEVQNLRDFIKFKIKNLTTFTDPDNIIVNNTSTLTSSSSRLHYTLHSPLTLGITDTQGRYTGQDPMTKQIREEIPNVTYRQIGDVQFLSAPDNFAYTVKMQGYQEGSFSLDVDKQEGDNITGSTSFQGIPSSTSTVATINVVPNQEIQNSTLNIDQNGDSITDKTLKATPDGITIYDITPPELQATFDTNAKDVIFSAQDTIDKNPTIITTKTSAILTDSAGNTTIIPFTKYKEKPTKLKFSYNKIIRNGVTTTVPDTNIVYDWQEKKGVLTDLDTKITIKGVEKYTFNYNKAGNITTIKEKIGKNVTVTKKEGFVAVTLKTSEDHLNVSY